MNPASARRRAEDPGRAEAADYGAIVALAADVRHYAKTRRWDAAQTAYEQAERIAHRRGLLARAARGQRALDDQVAGRRLGRDAANKRRKRTAQRAARPYVREAKDLRRKHPQWTLSSIIQHLRQTMPLPLLSARQLRRHLEPHIEPRKVE